MKDLTSYLFSILFVFATVTNGKDPDPFSKLASEIKPSVVTISTTSRGGSSWGVGTGFVVGQNGVIATNFHVIGDHREFQVELADGTICKPTEILGIDRSQDLALFKVDRADLQPISLGNSDQIKLGETILSIGNPLGYGLSISKGVVSAVRELEFGDGRPMIQVAIPIEAGSSGSPVINQSGEVIAILTIKSGGAMGFGVPVNSLKYLLGEKKSTPIKQWFTVGMLDKDEWRLPMGGNWRQRAGIIRASGMGTGFGGRTLCLLNSEEHEPPFDLEVEVRLDDERGAAGLVFASDGLHKHYGFYPTNGSLRLTSFNGPKVFDWNILSTEPSNAYLPNQWNLLRVRFEEGGVIQCYINHQKIFEEVDFTLKNGWIGFCKFREPSAEFRNLKVSPRLPLSSVSSEMRQRAYELSQNLEFEQSLSGEEIRQFAGLGESAHQALLDRAIELENTSKRVRKSAEKVRVSQIIAEIKQSLEPSSTQKQGDLLLASLLVAKLDNPDFSTQHYIKRVDRLAQRISKQIPPNSSKEEKLEILLDQFFQKMGYHGSTLDFHHRANSYLNEVIDDREGLPLSLALLLMEIGQRMELPIHGVAAPGHFLALYRETDSTLEQAVIIDAFAGSRINRQEADELSGAQLADDDFTPASNRDIISRMLRNLIRSAEWEKDTTSILRYLDALIGIDPSDEYNRTLRAMTRYQEGLYDEALSDIRVLIGEERNSTHNAPLLELERRLLQGHSPQF
jgi:serine protease Do